MTASNFPPSPTGRLSRSEPELQYFPGTAQARALSRRLKEAREASAAVPLVLTDISELEMRVVADYAKAGRIKVVRPAR